jgi:serine kinase of HPr protein (carbohydrate metabolism regulator)
VIHATSVAVLGASAPFGRPVEAAVLLLGNSGAGKSDVALRLIAMGARLIGDDQTQLFLRAGRVYAEAVPNMSGCIEIRGVGILRMDRAPASPVLLAVRLRTDGSIPRLPEPEFYVLPPSVQADVKLPLLTLNAFESSTPAKIAAAAAGLASGAFVAGGLPGAGFPFL